MEDDTQYVVLDKRELYTRINKTKFKMLGLNIYDVYHSQYIYIYIYLYI